MDARLDPVLGEPCADLVAAAFGHQGDGQVVGRRRPLLELAERDRHAARAVQRLAVAGRDPCPAGVLRRQAPELNEPHRRPQLVEAVVEAVEEHVVTRGVPAVARPGQRRHPVRAQEPKLLGEPGVVRDDHPSLAHRHVLVREEAEAADEPESAARLATPRRPRRMGGILDHDEVVPVGDLPHGLHVARKAAVVEDDDRLRSGPDRGFEVSRVEIEVVRADDVAEDRRRPRVCDRVRGGHEVQRRKHDLVSRADTGREQREVQRSRSVRDCQSELDADELGELALELLDPRPHAPPAGLHDVIHSRPQLIVDLHVGRAERSTALSRRLVQIS